MNIIAAIVALSVWGFVAYLVFCLITGQDP
jgi:hypothetical protein